MAKKRTYASPTRPRSPGRRSSRRPRRASPPTRSPSSSPKRQAPVRAPPMYASPARWSCSPPPDKQLSPASTLRLHLPRPPLAGSPVMAKKGAETRGGGDDASADRPYASPTRPSSPRRRSSRRPRRASPPTRSPSSSPRCSRHQTPVWGPPMCASPARQSCSPPSKKPRPSSSPRLPLERYEDYAGASCGILAPSTTNKVLRATVTRNEALDTAALTEKKTNPGVDLIWVNAQTSSGRVLGQLSVDLDSERVSASKCVSATRRNLVNAGSTVNEPRTSELPNEPPSGTISGCSTKGLNHKIFICPCELSRSEPLRVTSLQNKAIPGSNDDADFLMPKSCHTLNGMINAVTYSHSRSLCYNGNLSRENFRETEEGDVKLTGVQPGPFTIAGAKLDNNKVADIIENELFADIEIPPSVAELLKLLRTGEIREEGTMSNSISLMSELERMSLFSSLLKSLMELKDIDPTAYTDITNAMEARSSCWGNWGRTAGLNDHLLKILNFIDPGTGKPVQYPPTVIGLLRFVRNSIEHLPKHAYDRNSRTSLYYLHEIDYIISGTYKGLYEALQSAMSSAGKTSKW